MKTFKDFLEAANRAQQAAIAIAKKKSGKYDKDGKRIKEAQGPCWDGYEMRGMKKKGGKMVPNCVPVGEGVKQDKEIKDREGSQPAKYYAKDAEGDDMSKSTKKARARHFEKERRGLLLAMLPQKLNHLNTPKNLNRCLVKQKLKL